MQEGVTYLDVCVCVCLSVVLLTYRCVYDGYYLQISMQLVVNMLYCENIPVITMMNQMSLMETETATRSIEMAEKK